MIAIIRIIATLWCAGYWISQVTVYLLKHEFHTAGYAIVIGFVLCAALAPKVGRDI